jgi:signal transduction histidine kinase
MVTPDLDGQRILIHAPIGRDGSATADLLRHVGLSAQVFGSLPGLTSELQQGAAAIFVTEEGLFGKDLVRLTDWLKDQPAWSDLPIVVLTSKHEHTTVVAWRKQLVGFLGNVSFLERPIQPITLTSAMQSAVRARTRQYEVRALIEARDKAAGKLEALVEARTAELAMTNAKLVREIAEREEFEVALRQAQKIEAIGQLTGGVAHDFNNLLMVITGGLSLLDKPQSDERRQRILDGMRNAADRGAGLSKQLLAFARRKPLTAEPVDLARRINGMRDLLDRTLRGDVHVETEFAQDLWPASVDPAELELVLLNLCVNARDAMPQGGTIIIRAENAPGLTNGSLNGDFVRLTIADTGSGMPPEVLAKVFEPFFTTKEIGKGSGLGLPQVHGFAKQSGGSVEIDSSVGAGTTITLILPRSAEAPASDSAHLIDLSVQPIAQRSRGSMLLVEDDNEVATLVSEMLQELGWKVTRAASAEAALGALANSRDIDLIFSDIMMPGGMNGVELAREIRSRRPNLPIVLTSGYSEAAVNDARAEGISLLPKPYRLEELDAALSAVSDA